MAKEEKKSDGTLYAERIEKIKRSSGKNGWIEERKTTVVRIWDLPCDWWTPNGSTPAANSKKFEPKPVNATVILRWDGASKDEEKEIVILDTDPSKEPFVGFDHYDDRSKIENTLNREAKENWFLENHPERCEAGVRVHAYFVFMCMALTTAFRKYLKEAEEAEEEEVGITRYRRQLKIKNREKSVVFYGNHFGIFRINEFMLLAGLNVRECNLKNETVEQVLARFSVCQDTS